MRAGYTHNTWTLAVRDAIGEDFDRPDPRRVRLAVRCSQGDLLGRVISVPNSHTRTDEPYWMGYVLKPFFGRDQLADFKAKNGGPVPPHAQWVCCLMAVFGQPVPDPLQARCRCGDLPAAPKLNRIDGWNLRAAVLLGEIAAGRSRIRVSREGVPIPRAR